MAVLSTGLLLQLRINRDADPVNEFTQTPEILMGAFPHLFMRGCGPFDTQGPPGVQAMRHMMLQFHCQFATSHQLILYLFNMMRRTETIRKISARVRNHEAAFQRFMEMLDDPDFEERLIQARDNPDLPESRRLAAELEAVIQVTSAGVGYTKASRQQSISHLYNMAQKFGLPGLFVTITLDDAFHGLSVRMTLPSRTNFTFPASGEGFMEALRQGAERFEEVTISDDVLYNRIASNPVAAAETFHYLLDAILEHLFGLKAVSGVRRRRIYLNQPKGIFGHLKAHGGCIESTGRGALHYHGVLFTEINSDVIEKGAHLPAVADGIRDVLDSFVRAWMPPESHLKRQLKQQGHPFGNEPHYRPAKHVDLVMQGALEEGPGRVRLNIERLGQQAQMTVGNHTHTGSCRIGEVGKHSCRYGFARALVDRNGMITQIVITPEMQARQLWP